MTSAPSSASAWPATSPGISLSNSTTRTPERGSTLDRGQFGRRHLPAEYALRIRMRDRVDLSGRALRLIEDRLGRFLAVWPYRIRVRVIAFPQDLVDSDVGPVLQADGFLDHAEVHVLTEDLRRRYAFQAAVEPVP